MRVAVVYYAEKQRDRLKELAQALARGIQSQNVLVDVMDARDLNGKLTIYQYVALGTEVTGNFGGKIPPGLAAFLKTSGHLVGKRCFAFLPNRGLRREKSLLALMKVMEAEGMLVAYSDLLQGAAAAESAGKKLDIQPKH